MNIYYIDVEMFKDSDRWITGIHNKTNLVIAESEEDAISIMKSLTHPYYREVKVTEGVDRIVITGNGDNVEEYLDEPDVYNCKTQKEWLDKFNNHYIRYNYKIYDKGGEVEMLNYYQHFGIDEFPKELPKEPVKKMLKS